MEPLERIFQFEDFTLDLRRGCLRGPEGEIELRPKSFDVLRHLVENAGRLVPKDEIIGAVWRNLVVSDESLARCISDVRLALGDRRQRIIKTVPRRGYLFAAETGVKSASRAAVEPGVPASSPPALDPPSEALEVQVPGSRSAVDRATSAALLDQQQLAERRQLTVMACEFAGLAALSGLDPEELQTAVAAYRQRCADIIGQHHGYVAHDLEDGFHAYFGYPKASEYDAEHAVRAGLALLRSAEEPTVSWPAPQPRIGLASGLVVITGESGIGNRGTATAVGETPLVAKHLQMAAVAGSLVLDQTTRQLVAGLFEYRDLGGVARDGHPGVVPAWRVTGASSADNRFEARRIPDAADSQAQSGADAPATTAPSAVAPQTSLSPFVGRARELEILEGCLDEAGGDIRAIDIVGEPGIGKSRLLHEFRRHLSGSKVRVWLGNCWPGDEQMPFRPFIEVVRRSFRLAPDDPEVEIAGKIEARLALVGLATPENLGLLLNLLGLKPPANSLRGLDDVLVGLRTRDLLLQLVREGSRAAPVVVLLEDLHWIDNASQDLLARLIGGPSVGAVAFVHTITRRLGRTDRIRPSWYSNR